MKRILLALVLILCCGVVAAQERVTLTSPQTYPTNTSYAVDRVTLDYGAGTILIQLKGDNGEAASCLYAPTTTPTGATLLTVWNKANLSNAYDGTGGMGSLKQRILHRLVVLGEASAVCGKSLTGAIAGSVP